MITERHTGASKALAIFWVSSQGGRGGEYLGICVLLLFTSYMRVCRVSLLLYYETFHNKNK